MTNERLVGELVRAWVHQELPGDLDAANVAAASALAAYEDGASVTEACRQARAFVGSWCRHPAHQGLGHDAVVRLVS